MQMETELSSLTLVAANKEQTIASRHRTFPQWGRGLTLEQYLARDAQLDILEHATNGRFVTWVLVPRNDTTTMNFKCSCETFRRPSLARVQGKVQDVIGYGIASVYTPPENRGKGYARHMMSLLHWVLAPRSSSTGDYALTRDMFPTTWGEPPSPVASCGDAKFSVLYSDIGTFYQLCGTTGGSDGWVVRDPIGTVWDVSKFSARPTDTNTQIEWLSEDACKTLWAEDAKAMRDDLSNYTPATKTLFTFRPDTGVATFQLRRTVFFLPGQSAPMPQKWGVCISNQNQVTGPSQAFATWTIDIRPEPPSTLIVTRLRSTVELFPTLVELIIAAAKEMDIGQVEVWNLPPKFATLASDLHGVTSTREDHLNAMKWYGPESVDEVEWVFNEKFAWC